LSFKLCILIMQSRQLDTALMGHAEEEEEDAGEIPGHVRTWNAVNLKSDSLRMEPSGVIHRRGRNWAASSPHNQVMRAME
jgi:hypothetical protein